MTDYKPMVNASICEFPIELHALKKFGMVFKYADFYWWYDVQTICFN